MYAFLGEGYSLTMTRGNECDEEKIKRLVSKFISGSEVKSNASGELIFSLPVSESSHFGSLFEALEKEKNELDVANIGLSVTTMEDVFLR